MLCEEMKKSLVSSNSLGSFPSPGVSKGWSSERLPHPTSSSSRRHLTGITSTPFCSGRALPSKWEDAERWICSPVSGSCVNNKGLSSNQQFQRRPKSKSGPIVPPPMGSLSLSPNASMQIVDSGGNVRSFLVGSPFSTGVLVPDGVSVNYCVGGLDNGQGFLMQNRSLVHGWSDLVSEDSLASSQDEKLDECTDAENVVTREISRRDMATQMSPEGSSNASSPRGRSSHCSSPAVNPPSDHHHPGKLEVREVQVDKGATIISWSRRHSSKRIKKRLLDFDDFYQDATNACKASWDLADAATSISKLQREEAKITAWENLQKAKAEAAIRKLEMKLEKKRSHSMDKILNKLKTAQMKAEEMRTTISARKEEKISEASHKIRSFHSLVRMSFLRTCFTCHAA